MIWVLLILSEREPWKKSQCLDTAMVWKLTLTMKTGYVEHQRGAQEALLLGPSQPRQQSQSASTTWRRAE